MATDFLQWYLAGICFIGLQTVVSFIICIAAYFQLCVGAERSSVDPIYKYFTLLCISAFTICIAGDLIHVIIRCQHFPDYPSVYELELALVTANDCVYFVGNISFFVLLLARVHSVFKLTHCKLAVFSFLIFLCIAASAAYCAIIAYFCGRDDIPGYLLNLRYAVVPLSIITFVLDISFFTIFATQMKQAAVDLRVTSNLYHELSNVLTKHIVLFSNAIFANQTYFLYLTYVSYELVSVDPYQQIPYLVVAYMIRTFEVSVNVFVLWAVININHNTYLCICRPCHLCTAKTCTKQNDLPLENPYYRLSAL